MLQSNFILAFANIGSGAKAAVPFLVSVLRDSNSDFTDLREAITALEKIGPEAKAALPALGGMLNRSDTELREDVLKAIDRIKRRN
jgi:hypothetical protein